MKNAWILRPYPHDIYRMKEFLQGDIVAIGWPKIGDLSDSKTRNSIKVKLANQYPYSSTQSLGQAVGNIYRFTAEIDPDDYLIVPDGSLVYIAIIKGKYHYDFTKDNDEDGYCHQRFVNWLFDKKAISRNQLTGRVFDSLKGRQTVFSTYAADIDDLIKNKKYLFNQNPATDLKIEYLKKLQSGLLRNVNSNTFEDAVCNLFKNYFPGLRRLSTSNSKRGDTDLIAELPGELVIRIQVKHFYPDLGEIKDWVVNQLADSMEDGDHGIIITSGKIGKEAIECAEKIEKRKISFIDGQEFVDILFENINNLNVDNFALFGLTNKIDFL